MKKTRLREEQLFSLLEEPGAGVKLRFVEKNHQIMFELDAHAFLAKGLAAIDVVNAANAKNPILPGGTAKIGSREYNVQMNGSTGNRRKTRTPT